MNQPYHLYLLNQQPRKSILKTAASQVSNKVVGSPKVAKTATFMKEGPVSSAKSISFGVDLEKNNQKQMSSVPIQSELVVQQSESFTKGSSSSVGTLPLLGSVSSDNSAIVGIQSSTSNPQQLSSSSNSSFYFQPSPSSLFQSLIVEIMPMRYNDGSGTEEDTPDNDGCTNSSLVSLMTNPVGNISNNGHSTNSSSNTSSYPNVFQRMAPQPNSSLLSLFPSIQKETQDTKMSQQQQGKATPGSSNAASDHGGLSQHSLINGGVLGLSNQTNMFKKDYSKAIRQFQNQTTNQFIQRTIASNLDNIQKNRPNIASDRSYLEGMELGMQLNGFLNKLTRDSKDYVKELLDDVARRTTTQPTMQPSPVSVSSPTLLLPTSPIATTTTPNPPTTVDPFVQSSIQNIMQKGQEQAFQTLFVRKCMQDAVSRAIHSSQH